MTTDNKGLGDEFKGALEKRALYLMSKYNGLDDRKLDEFSRGAKIINELDTTFSLIKMIEKEK